MATASKATLPAGTLAPVGAQFSATGTSITMQANLLGAITCEKQNLNGEITVNNGTTVEENGENTTPTQAGCKNGTKEVKVTTFNITQLKSSVTGRVTFSFVTAWDTGTLECTLTGSNVAGTYAVGSNVLSFSSASGVAGSPSACGTAKFSGSLALEQAGTENKLILD